MDPPAAENIELIPAEPFDPQAFLKYRAYVMRNGYGMTVREIARSLEMSTSWVSKYT